MKLTLKAAVIAIIAMTVFAATVPVTAQKMANGQNLEQRLEKMKKHLNLTDDQTAKIKAILETAKTEAMQTVNTTTDKEARRKAMMESRQKMQEKIKAVLTTEQQQMVEKEMEKHRH